MLKAAIRAAASGIFGVRPRRVAASKPARNKYMTLNRAKEQERAKRFYMVDTHPSGAPRSTPTMQQHSKRAHAAKLSLVK
ncbi:hypothetical protein [Paraburkholderia hospita]|uniref:hypothetical protein n=1 Tax=Paraburkholderia hospita TaxID=169430 RepID=UPI003ECDB23D